MGELEGDGEEIFAEDAVEDAVAVGSIFFQGFVYDVPSVRREMQGLALTAERG